jgi:hypothetical protein
MISPLKIDLTLVRDIWTVKAKNAGGARVSLQIDGQSGRIIGTI